LKKNTKSSNGQAKLEQGCLTPDPDSKSFLNFLKSFKPLEWAMKIQYQPYRKPMQVNCCYSQDQTSIFSCQRIKNVVHNLPGTLCTMLVIPIPATGVYAVMDQTVNPLKVCQAIQISPSDSREQGCSMIITPFAVAAFFMTALFFVRMYAATRLPSRAAQISYERAATIKGTSHAADQAFEHYTRVEKKALMVTGATLLVPLIGFSSLIIYGLVFGDSDLTKLGIILLAQTGFGAVYGGAGYWSGKLIARIIATAYAKMCRNSEALGIVVVEV